MMAALFLFLSGSIAYCFLGRRAIAIVILLLGLISSVFILWHHATSSLQILW